MRVMTKMDLESEFRNILEMGYGIVIGVGEHTGFHSDGICSESWFGNIPEMVGESCVPLQDYYLAYAVIVNNLYVSEDTT